MSVTLLFEGGWSERDASEAEARGYRSHVTAVLPDGRRYALVFYDPVRLRQDLQEESRLGRGYIAEPGMIVVDIVTRARMQVAVDQLLGDGFFEGVRPLSSDA
jgi:hypothetical protein